MLEAAKWNLKVASATEAKIAYSSMNPWSHSAQICCRVHLPGKPPMIHSAAPSGSSLKVTNDGFGCDCAPITLTYDKHHKSYTVTYKSPKFELAAKFDICGEPLQNIGESTDGEGLFQFKSGKPNGVKTQFLPRTNVSGILKLIGNVSEEHSLDGFGTCVFAIQAPPQALQRCDFVFLHSEEKSLVIYQLEFPNSAEYDKAHCSQIMLVDSKGETICHVTKNQIKRDNPVLDDFSKKYKIPQKVTHQASGVTRAGGKSISITIECGLQKLIEKIDVLSELPFLIRKFIQTFVTAPFMYQWYEDGSVSVCVDGVTSTFQGKMFYELSMLADLE